LEPRTALTPPRIVSLLPLVAATQLLLMVGLGLWLAYFLVTSDSFPGDGGHFYIPWLEIGVIALVG